MHVMLDSKSGKFCAQNLLLLAVLRKKIENYFNHPYKY